MLQYGGRGDEEAVTGGKSIMIKTKRIIWRKRR
jgi:hypothetical protein